MIDLALEDTMGDSDITVRPCTEADWPDVVELGNRFKKYLGLYPEKAIMESIRESHVLGAFDNRDLIGYVLFDLPYSDVRLVHLCVREGFQGRGVARMLTDSIQARHGDRQGIRLKCRRDYKAHEVWPSLGFRAQSLPTGRGRDKADMTAWWRSFGHPDLFSAALEDDVRVQAVLDTNVVLDIALDREPLTKEYFEAPALSDEVTYCITRSVQNELAEIRDPKDRRVVMSSLAKYEQLPDNLALSEELVKEILETVDTQDTAKDSSLMADGRVLAETILAGASVMITNDNKGVSI